MKVIEFKSRHSEEVRGLLYDMLDEIHKNGIDNMICICKTRDGGVLTGYSKKVADDYGLAQELLSHAQVMTLKRMIREEMSEND